MALRLIYLLVFWRPPRSLLYICLLYLSTFDSSVSLSSLLIPFHSHIGLLSLRQKKTRLFHFIVFFDYLLMSLLTISQLVLD